MFCESCRKTLTEAAASGEPLPRAAEEHLAACEACRAAFAREQALFALIDGGLRSVANVEVPASLVPGVRVQVANESVLRNWRLPVPVYLVAAALILAALGYSLWRAPKKNQPAPEMQTASPDSAAPARQCCAPTEAGENPQETAVVPGENAGQAKEKRSVRSAMTGQVLAWGAPEIIVSPEESAGLQRYVASLRERTRQETSVIAVKSDALFAIKPLEIASVEIGRLSIDPLDAGDAD